MHTITKISSTTKKWIHQQRHLHNKRINLRRRTPSKVVPSYIYTKRKVVFNSQFATSNNRAQPTEMMHLQLPSMMIQRLSSTKVCKEQVLRVLILIDKSKIHNIMERYLTMQKARQSPRRMAHHYRVIHIKPICFQRMY